MVDVGYSDAKRRCLELSSANRGLWLGGRRARELRSDALSTAEWSYLFGLFLADGYSDVNPRTQLYRVRFFLQGDEWDIAWKVMDLLGRTGVRPHVEMERGKDMVVVNVYSKLLLALLPDKKVLSRDAAAWDTFLRENSLFDLANGVPFCAGLMDGDGLCRTYSVRSRARRRQPCPGRFQVAWHFSQTRLSFLNDYFAGFVESLAPGSTSRIRRRGRVEGVCVNFLGREALLRAGFASWSLKAAKCVQQVSELLAEQARLRKAAGWWKRA